MALFEQRHAKQIDMLVKTASQDVNTSRWNFNNTVSFEAGFLYALIVCVSTWIAHHTAIPDVVVITFMNVAMYPEICFADQIIQIGSIGGRKQAFAPSLRN